MAKRQLAIALEEEVAAIRALEAALRSTGSRGGIYSLRIDRHFSRILQLMRPRIVQLTRRYGLASMREDAEQACAIGIHRAVQAWDPARARFSTLAHWQMRGELQSLRHRMMLDQRQSARTAGIRTVSMVGSDGRERAELLLLADDHALAAAERGASDLLARRLLDSLLAGIDATCNERKLASQSILGENCRKQLDQPIRERNRQIIRQTIRKTRALATAPTFERSCSGS